MQNIKSSLFLYLTKRQKAQLLGTLKAYFKKNEKLSNEELCYKFLEDEQYYINIKNPHFEFVGEYLEDENFAREIKSFFKSLEFERKQKEALKPYLEKQKELMRIQRKKAQEFKMSKLKPTKKQIDYYEKLTKAHKLEKKNVEAASRLDLRNWIMEIIDEYNK